MWTGRQATCPHAHRAPLPPVIVDVSFHTKRRGALAANCWCAAPSAPSHTSNLPQAVAVRLAQTLGLAGNTAPYFLRTTISIDAVFETTVQLSEIEDRKKHLARSGVYVIHEFLEENQEFSPYLSKAIYIGKAIGETVYSRCCKHRKVLKEYHLNPASSHLRPGKRFQDFGAKLNDDISKLMVTAAFMAKDQPHLISCTEEFLIYNFLQQHGHRPLANTR
jgi:hypothetical protein